MSRPPADFSADLADSHGEGGEPEWCAAYDRLWPGAKTRDMRQDGPHQRQGIDRILYLPDGNRVTIDEKIRRHDFGDYLLELWDKFTAWEDRRPGWLTDPEKRCTHLAYLVLPTRTCTLLPLNETRRAWAQFGPEWRRAAGTGLEGGRFDRWMEHALRCEQRTSHVGRAGFSLSLSGTKGMYGDSRWRTLSIHVPPHALLAAITAVMVVQW